jgi:uncharacterized protein (TIGR02145 family)
MHNRLTNVQRLNFVALVVLFIQLSLSISHVHGQDITIGTQTWTSKNLDVSTFRNGEAIPEAKSKEEWSKAGENKTAAFCYYDYDSKNGKVFGKLYNWFAIIDSRGLAPKGYHIPSDAEWTILTDKLGGEGIADKKMKSTTGWGYNYSGGYTNDIPCTNCKDWSRESLEGRKSCPNCLDWSREYRDKVPCHTCKDSRYLSYPKAQCKICTNTRYTKVMVPKDSVSKGGDNSSGFNALPGGVCFYDGNFCNIPDYGFWWSSSENDTYFAWDRYLNNSYTKVFRNDNNKKCGFSVRCLRD